MIIAIVLFWKIIKFINQNKIFFIIQNFFYYYYLFIFNLDISTYFDMPYTETNPLIVIYFFKLIINILRA